MQNVDLDTVKELKVRVPARYHNQLQVLKLLTGTTMTDAVQEALNDYFADESNRRGASLLAEAAGKT